MALLTTSADIKDDALFRAGEKTDGTSDYDAKADDWLNKAYRAIWMGGTEFDPDLNENWWWLKAKANIILEPSYRDGSVNLTKSSTFAFLATPPSFSAVNYFLKSDLHSDVFRVIAHNPNGTQLTFDSVYTGDNDNNATYRLMKVRYDLASDFLRFIEPIYAYRPEYRTITSTSHTKMRSDYPLSQLPSGTPRSFSFLDDNSIEFSHFGTDSPANSSTGDLLRLDYEYLSQPSDLADDSTEPVIPLHYRYILSDALLFYILFDKEDSRADGQSLVVRAGLKAMVNENKERWNQSGEIGQIYPRQADTKRFTGPLRTESGLIIG